MTREEEREQAWFSKACLSTHCYDEKSFKEAAEWADKTMIDKACKWLRGQVYQEYPGGPLERLITDDMINQFIKTMKE